MKLLTLLIKVELNVSQYTFHRRVIKANNIIMLIINVSQGEWDSHT